jgi:hypothetical protein
MARRGQLDTKIPSRGENLRLSEDPELVGKRSSVVDLARCQIHWAVESLRMRMMTVYDFIRPPSN